MALSKIKIRKQVSETRLVTMEFGNKMATGETITDVDTHVSDPVGLSFANAVVSTDGQKVNVLVSGGSIPDREDCNERAYKVTITCSTDASQILENDGILVVAED
jgi:hypothetical protein